MRFDFIEDHRRRWPVRLMCKLLEVSVSGFYRRLTRPPSARQKRAAELTQKIRAVHQCSRQTYGSPRGAGGLKKPGGALFQNPVHRLMEQAQIAGKAPRPFRP